MALSVDAFITASQPRRALCTVAKILDGLDPKDRAVLQGALDDPGVTHAAIERVLIGEGYKLGQSTVARHRRHGCACDS